jgi:hypothetical protein
MHSGTVTVQDLCYYAASLLFGITSRWREIQMLTEVSVYMKYIIIRHFISLEPAFWATLPLCITVDCTVGGSKKR